MSDLEANIQQYQTNKSSLDENMIYLYSQDLKNNKPNVQDVRNNDEKQLIMSEYMVFTLGTIAAATVIVFHIFNK